MKTARRRERKSFSKIDREWNLQIPNLLEVQLKSFRDFLQMDVDPMRRRNEGLQEVFTGVFPISDPRELFSLEFVAYEIGEPKYSMDECVERDLTFSAPLKARLRLITREEVDGVKRDKDVIEQEVYLGELPLITDSGTFIINGAERVIVVAAPPFAGRLLRRADAPERQDALLGAHHPVPRLVGGVQPRRQRHHARAHRPQAQAPGHGAAARARIRGRPRDPRAVLRDASRST